MNIFKTLPKKLGVAFSGGVDSSVLLHLAVNRSDVTLLTYDHKNETSEKEVQFAHLMAEKYNLKLSIRATTEPEVPAGISKEAFWGGERNQWFKEQNMLVATGHNLNDAVEWYLMTAMNGNGGFYMNYRNGNVIRPLLLLSKKQIRKYAADNTVAHIEDPTNADVEFNKRNAVRHVLLPAVEFINPGILNTVKRNIVKRENMKSFSELKMALGRE